MYTNALVMLVIYAIVVYVAKQLLVGVDTDSISDKMGMTLMSLPRPVMMILMAIPEQLVMAYYEPSMPLMKRLLVSVAMYVIHFAWNGFIMKPKRSYNELVWILGTAMYALNVLGVKRRTAVALIAADAVMTLALRGLA